VFVFAFLVLGIQKAWDRFDHGPVRCCFPGLRVYQGRIYDPLLEYEPRDGSITATKYAPVKKSTHHYTYIHAGQGSSSHTHAHGCRS
jgi:hypothetical protein